MRTTLSIDDNLLERAKKRAREQGITLGRYVDDALREHLTARQSEEDIHLTVVHGGGARPGVDVTSNRAMLEAMDEHDGVSR